MLYPPLIVESLIECVCVCVRERSSNIGIIIEISYNALEFPWPGFHLSKCPMLNVDMSRELGMGMVRDNKITIASRE